MHEEQSKPQQKRTKQTTYTQHPFTFNIDEGWQAMWRAVKYTEVSRSHTWEK